MIDIGNTLLYSFFAVLQVYVYKSQGAKAYARKIISSAGSSMISGIVYNFFIPIYSVIEVSRMASMDNVKLYWILAITTLITLLIRLGLNLVVGVIADIDQKIITAYSLVNTLPALGSLTLVLGKALCYEGCPLYGDPQCDNILGLMMITYLIYNFVLFILAFIMMSSAKNKYAFIKEKLKFIWHRYLTKQNKEDLYAKSLVYKYIKNEEKASEVYKEFKDNHSLVCNDEFEYTYTSKLGNNMIAENKTINKDGIEVDDYNRTTKNKLPTDHGRQDSEGINLYGIKSARFKAPRLASLKQNSNKFDDAQHPLDNMRENINTLNRMSADKHGNNHNEERDSKSHYKKRFTQFNFNSNSVNRNSFRIPSIRMNNQNHLKNSNRFPSMKNKDEENDFNTNDLRKLKINDPAKLGLNKDIDLMIIDQPLNSSKLEESHNTNKNGSKNLDLSAEKDDNTNFRDSEKKQQPRNSHPSKFIN